MSICCKWAHSEEVTGDLFACIAFGASRNLALAIHAIGLVPETGPITPTLFASLGTVFVYVKERLSLVKKPSKRGRFASR